MPIGLVNKFDISTRGDAYQISDRDEDSLVGELAGRQRSVFIHLSTMLFLILYPRIWVGPSWLSSPLFAFTASTNAKNDTGIPNEDSQDVQIDATNILDAIDFQE